MFSNESSFHHSRKLSLYKVLVLLHTSSLSDLSVEEERDFGASRSGSGRGFDAAKANSAKLAGAKYLARKGG